MACNGKNTLAHSVEIGQGSDLVVFDLGVCSPSDGGCVLELMLRLAQVCPEKRVALALTVTELDENGVEYQRGQRTLLIPARHGDAPADVTLPNIRFVLPGELDVSGGGKRRILVRTDSHYVDYNARCQLDEA